MGQNHPNFFLSHFIKLSHILANYTKGQVAKLIRTILKMSLELTYRIWITLYVSLLEFFLFSPSPLFAHRQYYGCVSQNSSAVHEQLLCTLAITAT
jgi:hypothetical protein